MFVWDRLWRTDTSFFGGHLRIPNPMCIIYRSVLYMQSTPCQILNCKLTVTATHYLLVKLPTKRCSNPSSFITILWTDPKRQMQIKTNSHLLHKLLRIAILQTCFLFNFFVIIVERNVENKPEDIYRCTCFSFNNKKLVFLVVWVGVYKEFNCHTLSNCIFYYFLLNLSIGGVYPFSACLTVMSIMILCNTLLSNTNQCLMQSDNTWF